MSITLEELKKSILSQRAQLYRMQTAENYEENSQKEGKYFRFENNEGYDPWFTFIKVLSVKKVSANHAVVISFEKNINGQGMFWNKYKRKIQLLGEEISQDDFDSEYERFISMGKVFAIQVRL